MGQGQALGAVSVQAVPALFTIQAWKSVVGADMSTYTQGGVTWLCKPQC